MYKINIKHFTLILFFIATSCTPSLHSTGDRAGQDEWIAPENTWDVNAPSDDLVGEGFSVGEVLPDCRMTDQFNDLTSLWQFYGNVMVVDISTMWCAPCQDMASYVQETYDDYKKFGFTYITILSENVSGDNPSNDDLNMWADAFEIAEPVLADEDKACTYNSTPSVQYPVILVIDREMRVFARVTPSDEALRMEIEDAINE